MLNEARKAENGGWKPRAGRGSWGGKQATPAMALLTLLHIFRGSGRPTSGSTHLGSWIALCVLMETVHDDIT